jgi:small subunit ribosomal protein S6
MERTMRINEDVLRFMTIRVDALEEGPSAVMQSRGSRDDRPRRSYGDDRPRDDRPRDDRPREDRAPRESAAPASEGGRQ